MRSYRICIRISGSQFMAEQFQSEASLPEPGASGIVKDMGSPLQKRGSYWMSKTLDIDVFDEDVIHAYISKYVMACIESKKYESDLVSLVINALYSGSDDLSGIYISYKIIEILYEAKASIDIDQYIFA